MNIENEAFEPLQSGTSTLDGLTSKQVQLSTNPGATNQPQEEEINEVIQLLKSNEKQACIPFSKTGVSEKVLADITEQLETEEKERISQEGLDPNGISNSFRITKRGSNCHDLSRLAAQKLGWKVVSGYIFSDSDFENFRNKKKENLKLTAHSVVENCAEDLIEMTLLYSLGESSFLRHTSGSYGCDLTIFMDT
jgi:hypothetical protein